MANSSIVTSATTTRPVPEGYVRLISADNYEFLVEEECAAISKVIKRMLEGALLTREVFFNHASLLNPPG